MRLSKISISNCEVISPSNQLLIPLSCVLEPDGLSLKIPTPFYANEENKIWFWNTLYAPSDSRDHLVDVTTYL